MISIKFSTRDLANTRFAFSPLDEAVESYIALTFPEKRHALNLPWIREAQEAIKDLDTTLLDVLINPLGRRGASEQDFADFLMPFPSVTLPNFYDELETLRKTPAEVVRQVIRCCYGSLPQEPLRPFLVDPEAALHALADLLQTYWERTLAHHWPRLQALLEADVLYRARILALYGPEALLDGLIPRASYTEHKLVMSKFDIHGEFTLAGYGLLLIPSIFTCPIIGIGAQQEWLSYPVRGLAYAWSSPSPAATNALSLLLGPQRARLLQCLTIPSTTSATAQLFKVTPGAISQQLNWLRQVGMVTTQRRGRRVYYEASMLGRSLLESYGEENGQVELKPPQRSTGTRGYLGSPG